MLFLAALVVQLPFFVAFLLEYMFVACEHCRSIWLTHWPMLPGLVPAYFLRLSGLGEWAFWIFSSGITLSLIMLPFVLGRQSNHWRYFLGAAFLLSCILAALSHGLLAA